MAPPVITSPRNPRVVAARRLQRARSRREAGLTLLEGPHLLAEARHVRIREVFGLAEDVDSARRAEQLNADWLPVTEQVLERLAPTEHPRGPVAVIEIPASRTATADLLLVLWGVSDPGNAGTLIRTAAAFGAEVLAAEETVDPWSPKVLRAGAGGHFRTVVERRPDLELDELRDGGYRIAATVVSGGVGLPGANLTGRLAVLVGEEAHGLPEQVMEAADLRLSIPMPGGMESLNAAVAGALVLYEARRAAMATEGAAETETYNRPP